MAAHIMRLASALLAGWMLAFSSMQARADDDTKAEVDEHVDAALRRFKEKVKDASEYLETAKAVLVVPEVRKLGVVAGGHWGKGALREPGKPNAYYKMKSGSIGLLAGYEEADFVFVFFTEEAVREFKSSNRFSLGANAGVTMVQKEANVSASTLRETVPIAGFAFGEKGVIGDVSVEGTTFKRVHPKE